MLKRHTSLIINACMMATGAGDTHPAAVRFLNLHFMSKLPKTPNSSFTSYLHSEVFSHHTVPGCQISMDKLVGVEVSHAVSDLTRHLKHLLQRRERQARPLLLET